MLWYRQYCCPKIAASEYTEHIFHNLFTPQVWALDISWQKQLKCEREPLLQELLITMRSCWFEEEWGEIWRGGWEHQSELYVCQKAGSDLRWGFPTPSDWGFKWVTVLSISCLHISSQSPTQGPESHHFFMLLFNIKSSWHFLKSTREPLSTLNFKWNLNW